MSAITGSRREFKEYVKRVGLGEFKVIAINPDREEITKILGSYEKEKDPEYIGEKDDINYVRLEFWLKDLKFQEIFKLSFFLKDQNRMNKDQTKYQFINVVGRTAWAEGEDTLHPKFAARDFRKAKIGEEEFYNFITNWLELKYEEIGTRVEFDLKKLFKGNVSEIREQIGGNLDGTVICLATVQIVESKDDQGNITRSEYQKIYNRGFLPGYNIKQIRLKVLDQRYLDYIAGAATKKPLEWFLLKITDENYGCKDFYGGIPIKEIREYDPSENLAASDDTHIHEEEEEDSPRF